MGKRMCIPTARALAGEAKKLPQRSKKSKKAPGASTRAEPTTKNETSGQAATPVERPSATIETVETSDSESQPTSTQKPDQRARVCNVANKDDWDKIDEVIEVDVHGHIKNLIKNLTREGPEEELGKFVLV